LCVDTRPPATTTCSRQKCCCSTRCVCIGLDRAHTAAHQRFELETFFFLFLLIFHFKSSKLQRTFALHFFLFFWFYFSALFLFSWMKIFLNFYEIFVNLRHFHWVTIIEHTQMKTSDESGKKNLFFFIYTRLTFVRTQTPLYAKYII